MIAVEELAWDAEGWEAGADGAGALEAAGADGANEKVEGGLDGSVAVVAAAGVVLIFGSSEVFGLFAAVAPDPLDGAKLKVVVPELVGFSDALFEAAAEAGAVEEGPNRDGVVVELVAVLLGAFAVELNALVASPARAACCLSLIFDIAAASKSCFSHLEYDFVFCNLGLSVAGEAGA